MYGELKRDIVEIIKMLCEMKQVVLIDGKECRDQIYSVNSTENECIRIHVISERKEYADAF